MSGGREGRGFRRLALWAAGSVFVGVAVLGLLRGSPPLSGALRWARAKALSELGAVPKPPAVAAPREAARSAYKPLPGAVAPDVAGRPSTIRLLDTVVTAGGSSGFERIAVGLDGQTRNALAGVVPFRFVTRLRLPAQADLWLALDHEGAGLDGDGVEFRVGVRRAASSSLVLRETLSALQTQWREVRVDLGRWAGQEVDLEFEAVHAARGAHWHPRRPVTAYWGDLFVHSGTPDRARPNIVLLLVDTLRRDHVSAYGYERPTTPQIDALAAEGVRFESAFANAPWTDPSVLTVLTGVYPSDLWQPAPWAKAIERALPVEPATMAELLGRAGYFTIAASDHPGISAARFGRGFDVFADLYHSDGPYTWRKTEPPKLLAQIRELLRGRAGGGVLAYIHLLYPHSPYAPSPDYLDLLGLLATGAQSAAAAAIDRYDAEVRLTDDVIGVIRRSMVDEGMAADAILVVVSDHGEAFGEHGLLEHGNSLYNELLRIPLILHAPGRLPRGAVVKAAVQLVDVLPTLLDLVGRNVPAHMRGISLVPLIEGGSAAERAVYSEFPHSRIVEGYCIQSRSLKLVLPAGDGTRAERYDMLADPGERSPVSKSTSEEEVLLRLAQEIRQQARGRRAALAEAGAVPPEGMLQRLRALGYLR